MRCTSRRRFVQKLPKTTCEGCFEELTGTCFGANSFRGKSFCARHECWHQQCDESPVAKLTSQFQNDKKVYEQSNYCYDDCSADDTETKSSNTRSRGCEPPATPNWRHWQRSKAADASRVNADADKSGCGRASAQAVAATNLAARTGQVPQTA